MSIKHVLRITAVLAFALALSTSSFAAWEVAYLAPAGSPYSIAWGTSGGQQVGYAQFGSYDHAGLWSGTAQSWVDLNPAGSTQSLAYGISGGQQVGWASIGGSVHAGLWSGTAQSWVDLNPAGSTESRAWGTSGGQQVGYAQFGSYDHAGLWSGTAQSWVDLNPAGSTGSRAYRVSGGQQVGYAQVGSRKHASLWSGTAESWVDLHGFLGANYIWSEAYSVEVTGSDIWVAGYARNPATGSYEAVLWHNVVPEPSSILALGSGLLALGGLIRRRK